MSAPHNVTVRTDGDEYDLIDAVAEVAVKRGIIIPGPSGREWDYVLAPGKNWRDLEDVDAEITLALARQ